MKDDRTGTTETEMLQGLQIGGLPLVNDDERYFATLRFLLVPPERQQDTAFASGDRAAVAQLEDPLLAEILTALAASGARFDTLEALADEMRFRRAAVEAMARLNSGSFDADYFNPDLGPTCAMGWVVPQQTGGPFWSLADAADPCDPWFTQHPDTAPSAAISADPGAAFPFRGECAGAFQLAVLLGLRNGLGGAAFDALVAAQAPLFIGPWRLDDRTPNAALRFLVKAEEGAVPIPGDYLYFQNKDNYSHLAPNGFWTGLNAMYMGRDALGTPHYSGLGASWLSEDNLRMTVVNAYFHDCYPRKIHHPQTECRFTLHYRLSLTAPPPTMPGTLPRPQRKMPPLHAERLQAAGFMRVAGGRHHLAKTTIGALEAQLGIDPAALRQVPSAGIENPPQRLRTPEGTLALLYHDPSAGRHDPQALVDAAFVPRAR